MCFYGNNLDIKSAVTVVFYPFYLEMYCCLSIFRVARDNLGLGGSKELAQDSATFSTRNLLS